MHATTVGDDMKTTLMIGALAATAFASSAMAEISYLKCEMQTTFRKPYVHDTEWVHTENKYTKYFKIDSAAKMVSAYNRRSNAYTAMCSDKNASCAKDWKSGTAFSIDGTKATDSPVTPYLDFRRSFALNGNQGRFVIADYGQAQNGKPNMSWTYEGPCEKSEEPKAMPRMGPGAGASRPPENPKYEKPTAPAQPVSKEEADKALAGYYGNTMTGYSGGGHWFHMWFLDKNGLAYTSDDEDMSSEGKPRQWYVGKDSTGYRLCGEPIPAEGKSGCYPLPVRKVGEAWVQHDMDGDAYFSLLPGRQ